MKKIVIPMVIASFVLATLACRAFGSATPMPLFVPAATEVRPPTATPEPSPTPVPLKLEVLGVAVYGSWEDQNRKYETPAGYAWLAVQVRVLSGDLDEAVEGWEREDRFPAIVTGDGIELSDGTLVYVLEDGTLGFVFRVPGDAPTPGLLLVMPDGAEYPLESFFQQQEVPQLGPQA